MKDHETISAERLPELELREGDRVSGDVAGGYLHLHVIHAPSQRKGRSGSAFVTKWAGRFKNDDLDLTNDPRARAILER